MSNIPIYLYWRTPSRKSRIRKEISDLLSTKKPIEPTKPQLYVNKYKFVTKKIQWSIKETFVLILLFCLFIFPGIIYLIGKIKVIKENNYWYKNQDLYFKEESRIIELNKQLQDEYDKQLLKYQIELREYDERLNKILSVFF